MMLKMALSAFLTSATCLCAQTGTAPVICDDTKRLEQQISGFGQSRKHGQGLRGPDTLLEIWIEPASGDWTVVQTYTNGTSCILAMGEHWETLKTGEDPA